MFSRLKIILKLKEQPSTTQQKQPEDSEDEPSDRKLSIAQTSDWLKDLRKSQMLVPHLSQDEDAEQFVNQVYKMKPKESNYLQQTEFIDFDEEYKNQPEFNLPKHKSDKSTLPFDEESNNETQNTKPSDENSSSSSNKSDLLHEFIIGDDGFSYPKTPVLTPRTKNIDQFVIVDTDYVRINGIEWQKLVKECKFDFRKKDKTLDAMIRQAVNAGLKLPDPQQTIFLKQHAYCLMLGISTEQISNHFSPLYHGLLSISEQRSQQSCDKDRFNHQIKIDVQRTLSAVNIKGFDEPFDSGRNPLYNVLSAYSEHDQNVRYMQGMNYMCALILISVQDEVIAFALFERIMLGKHNYAQVYEDKLTKLISLVKEIRKWMKSKHKKLLQHLETNDIYLETVLSSPFLALFTNLVDIDSALRVLDRFIYAGEQTIIEIIKQVFVTKEQELLEMNDTFDLQRALTQHLYRQAIQEQTFFPELKSSSQPSSRLVDKFMLFQ